MLRRIAVILIITALSALVASAAGAKGPYRAVLKGGDLPAPITVGDGIDDGTMFGGGGRMDPPEPYPQVVYTLELHYQGDEAGVPPVSTISYYPAHDGLPAAFRTSSGFFPVADDFDARLRALVGLPPLTSGGSSSPWYLVPALALGLVLVGLAVRRRASRSRAGPTART